MCPIWRGEFEVFHREVSILLSEIWNQKSVRTQIVNAGGLKRIRQVTVEIKSPVTLAHGIVSDTTFDRDTLHTV